MTTSGHKGRPHIFPYTKGVKIGKRLRRPRRNDKDVGSNPAATRNEKSDIGDPPTEGSPMVWTGSKWKTDDVKPN